LLNRKFFGTILVTRGTMMIAAFRASVLAGALAAASVDGKTLPVEG
jgi:hypothetical protein